MTIPFVPMTMMQIRIMWVLMSERLVLVPMRMWFSNRSVVMMLVMLIVNVSMVMRQSFVNMLVFVSFREVQPKA